MLVNNNHRGQLDIAYPACWTRRAASFNSTRVLFREPNNSRELRIDQTENCTSVKSGMDTIRTCPYIGSPPRPSFDCRWLNDVPSNFSHFTGSERTRKSKETMFILRSFFGLRSHSIQWMSIRWSSFMAALCASIVWLPTVIDGAHKNCQKVKRRYI